MSNPLRVVIACAVVLTACALRAPAQPLPADPSLVTGQLDNGLKYIVRKNANPPGRVAIWLHMSSGSLNETDRQRGIAHYLEHMAFNGSEHFPPGSVVPLFQSLGMTFGRDQNAFTNMEQTTFQLSLPDTKPETLTRGMTFFSDILFRLSLTPKEIDAERQIIQEERRRGLSGRQRTSFYVTEHIAPGSLYGQRITIGTEETINGVNEKDFHDYYGKWYAASNATLIVVADADPAGIVTVIKDNFSAAPKRERPTPQALNVKAYDHSFAIVASDPEVRSEEARIVRLEPARPPVTTVPQYRAELVARLGEMALNSRLEDKTAKGGTSYQNARVSMGNDSGALHTAEISGRAAPGKWKPALQEIALELQRARAFGFAQRELDDARKEIISGAERAVETESTTATQGIIGRINGAVATGDAIMSPQQRLDLLKQLLPSITADEIAKRFADEFDPKAVAFIAVLPTSAEVPTEAQLLDIGTKALAVKPTPETETAHATQLMTDLPKGGKVTEGAEHAASKVWSGWLSNNTRVHYRFMDERKDEVSISIALIGGELLETAANRGITSAAQQAWTRPATRGLTSTDIREIMTGRKINVRGGGGFGGGGRGGGGRGGRGGAGGAGAISLSISGSPEELETGFQLAYLMLTQPRIEPASFEQFQTNLKQMLQESLNNPMALGARTAGAAPYPDNEPRTTPVTVEQIDKLTIEGAQAWLDKLLKESPIEVTIVGDIPKDKALELASRYIGALPTRERVTKDAYASLRRLARPKGPRIIEKTVETPTQQAFVFSGFYGADDTNVADVRALSMAARILSTRMVTEVREEAQLVYSIGASSRAATTFPGFGVFSASAPTDPSKVDALVKKLAEMYELFAKNGPTAEELDVAKKQMANTFDEQMKQAGFWSGQINEMDFRGTSLDDVVGEPAAFQSLTAKQVQETFGKYYSGPNSIVVVVRPQGAGGPEKKVDENK
jgi:zinc protease